MAEQFDDLLLDEFAHSFYGYGNYGGQFWFIGMMEDDGKWFHFDVADERAVRVAILPDVIRNVAEHAHAKGVSTETLVNAWLIEHMHELAPTA